MILSNQVRCKKCEDTPFSAGRHDFKPCKCGAISVDGGGSYLRRVGDIFAYEDMSIEIPDKAAEAAAEAVSWALDNNRNSFGALCAVARALRDAGVALTPKRDIRTPRLITVIQPSRKQYTGVALNFGEASETLTLFVTASSETSDLDGRSMVGTTLTMFVGDCIVREEARFD